PHVKFFFATTEPNKVLPTIMSRCQRHDFNRLSMEDILTGIDPVIEKENIVVDDETRRLTARMADGSMRDALSLLDQMIAFCGNEVTFEKATSLLGIIPDALYFEVTDAVREKDRKKLLELMRSVYAQGFVLNDFIAGLSQHLLNLLVCKAESGEELLDLTADLRDRYAKESRAWDPKDLLRYGDLLTEIETNLKIVQQPRIYVETMMLKLLELDSSVAISDLISRLSADPPGSALLTGPQPPQVGLFTEPSAAAPPEATPKESFPSKGKENKNAVQNDVSEQKAGNEPNVELFEKVKQQWEAIIAKVSGNGTSLATFLSHGKPSGVTGGRLIISFPRKYRFQMDVLKKNALRIESSVEETVGEALKISFVVNQDEPVSEESNREETNPVTKRMLDLFGGEIVE
ncbi:MAG: hypothetical protein ACE5GH_07170, partial [Fidelibacterota bacterium]